MDRALWLLLFLRLRGTLRRRLRSLWTPQGLLLMLAGAAFVGYGLLLLSQGSPLAGAYRETAGAFSVTKATARSLFAPLLALSCLLTAAMTPGLAIDFSRAETDFLFSGPFSRAGLLLYKFVGYATGAFVSALFISLVTHGEWLSWSAAFLGTFLTLVFLQLLSASMGLLGQTLAAPVHRRLRWGFMGLGLLAGAGLAWQALLVDAGADVLATLRAARNSAAGRVVFAPFEVYASVLFAESAPGLAVWTVLAAGLDALLLAGLIRLDAAYRETVEAAGRPVPRSFRWWHQGRLPIEAAPAADIRIPLLPRWGGAGPLAWRQLTTAARSCRRTLFFLHLAAAFAGPALIVAVQNGLSASTAAAVVIVIGAIILPRVLLFDFRGDLERLDYLKSLPFRPAAVVLGQAMTPALLSTSVHAVLLGGAFLAAPDDQYRWVLGVALPMIVPLGFFQYAVENLIFLWFPWRVVPMGRMDFEFFGRMLVEAGAKLAALLGCCLAAGLLATVVYVAAGGSLGLALASAWLFVLAVGGAVTWAAARRFQRLDVAPGGRV